jgi:hypothetical protein
MISQIIGGAFQLDTAKKAMKALEAQGVSPLSPEYLNNKMIDGYEQEIRVRAYESLGAQMIFDICELLREKIGEINDKVLGKYNEIIKA